MKPSTSTAITSAARAELANATHELRRKIKAVQSSRPLINRIGRNLQKIADECEGEFLSPFCWGGIAGLVEVNLRLTLRNLDGMKDPRLLKALELVEKKTGMVFDQTRDLTDAWRTDFGRNFIARLTLPDLLILVEVSATVKSDSPTCRKVVKAVRLQEVNEYEIVCD